MSGLLRSEPVDHFKINAVDITVVISECDALNLLYPALVNPGLQ